LSNRPIGLRGAMGQRQMHLYGYVTAGPTWHLYGSWRHPESDGLEALVPELQHRKLFRREYQHKTFRGNLQA
jgi:hypothetical protein